MSDKTDLGVDRVVVNHRTQYVVRELKLNPQVPAERFAEVEVPAGTEVSVQAETGRPIGRFRQEQTGTPTISRERYQEMLDEADMRDGAEKERADALNHLVDRPVAELARASGSMDAAD